MSSPLFRRKRSWLDQNLKTTPKHSRKCYRGTCRVCFQFTCLKNFFRRELTMNSTTAARALDSCASKPCCSMDQSIAKISPDFWIAAALGSIGLYSCLSSMESATTAALLATGLLPSCYWVSTQSSSSLNKGVQLSKAPEHKFCNPLASSSVVQAKANPMLSILVFARFVKSEA